MKIQEVLDLTLCNYLQSLYGDGFYSIINEVEKYPQELKEKYLVISDVEFGLSTISFKNEIGYLINKDEYNYLRLINSEEFIKNFIYDLDEVIYIPITQDYMFISYEAMLEYHTNLREMENNFYEMRGY